jgi:cation:H+ antiporter
LAAPLLVAAAAGIADETGLGDTFVGTTLLGVATSLPELATSLAAVRIGAFDMAVGAMLGSNAFNMFTLLIADLAYLPGPILADASPEQAIGGIGGILLMSLVIASLVHGRRWTAAQA